MKDIQMGLTTEMKIVLFTDINMGKTYKDSKEYKGTPIKKEVPKRNKRSEEYSDFILDTSKDVKNYNGTSKFYK